MLGSTTVFAETELEKQVKNSRLAISAFQCSFVAEDKKEQERLFQLGLNAGRDFLEFIKANPSKYEVEFFNEKVPTFWFVTDGPTTDFVLGRIYEEHKNEIYKSLPRRNMELRKIKKEKLYHKKNCALLGK
jgi:hypothetical protein